MRTLACGAARQTQLGNGLRRTRRSSDMTACVRCLAVSTLVVATSCTSLSRPWRRLADAVGSPPTLTLATAGTTRYRITLAETASAAERNAAGELAAYLERVTGVPFPTGQPGAGAGGPVIAVGPGAAKALLPELVLAKAGEHGLGDDGILVQPLGDNLILTGAEGARRGTLYAVYEFLEREVGVRWWTPTAESVPKHPTLVVRPAPTRYVPPFIYRETLCGAIRPRASERPVQTPLFAVRLRQNGHFAPIPADWGGHYTLIGWCHTFERLLPPAKYFKDHPEWYSEINGQRKHEKAQLCLTNEEMLAELSRNVIAAIRKEPDAGMISVAQNDWGGRCQCARCQALDEAEGSPAGSLLYGINRVAEAVEREFPGTYVETLAYQYTRKPPKTIRPRANVIVRLAVIERSAVHPIEHPINRPLRRDLEQWSAAAPNLYLWDYTANLQHPFTPEPRAFVYGKDLRLYRRLGAISVFCEHSHGASPLSDFDELHTWLLSRLLWAPDQDDRALVREFLNGYYGDAGRPIEAYLHLLSTRVGDRKVPSWSGPREAEWLDLATMNRATALFDDAVHAVAGDPELTARVQRARLSLDHQWLCGYAGYRYLAEPGSAPFGGPADFDRALADFTTRCRALDVKRIGYGANQTLEDYVRSLRLVGESVPGRLVLGADPVHKAYAAGARQALPQPLDRLPRKAVIDLQEDRMSLFRGAEAAFDPAAVNHGAARIDPAVVSWAVQARDLPAHGVSGRWHAYAVVRVEALAESGLAFTGGVYDSASNRNLLGISQRLEGQVGGTPDPNIGTATTTALSEPITDGQYHLYDLGTHDFSDTVYLWIGTTGGVRAAAVKAIWVDRFVFVREPAAE